MIKSYKMLTQAITKQQEFKRAGINSRLTIINKKWAVMYG